MTLPAPTYDLVLLLDTQADASVRAKILTDVREAIAGQGELLRHDEWGVRALAYPIEHRGDAEYHLLQFHASTPGLLGELERSLRITDGIVRFRIIKLESGTPEAPDMRPGRRPEADVEAHPSIPPPVDSPPEHEPDSALEPSAEADSRPEPSAVAEADSGPEAEHELTVGEPA